LKKFITVATAKGTHNDLTTPCSNQEERCDENCCTHYQHSVDGDIRHRVASSDISL